MRNLSLALMIVLLAGCGSEGSGSQNEPCTVIANDGPFNTVDLLINSPLPEVFSANCPSANISELEIFLTIPGQDSCFLEVVDGAVTGCCPKVATDQNAFAALIYRAPPAFALGEQTQVLELPTTSPSVVNVSFDSAEFDGTIYDGDNDGEKNIDEYCAGTLN